MIHRSNRTGRKKIAAQHAQVTLHKADHQLAYFEIDLALDGYGFPDDANVRAEAWRSNAAQRWDLGTISDLSPLSQDERRLIEVPETAAFRVAVVAADGSGQLFGLSGRLHPRSQSDGGESDVAAESLLLVQLVSDLGQEVWRLDFGDDERPILQLNNSIADMKYIVEHDSSFRSLVIPEVLRAILQRALLIARVDLDDSEPNAWTDWLDLARRIAATDDVPVVVDPLDVGQQEAALSWIEQVVQRFASNERLNAATTYSKALEVRP